MVILRIQQRGLLYSTAGPYRIVRYTHCIVYSLLVCCTDIYCKGIHSLFLYCICNSQGQTKFGFSKDPHARVRALQTGSADDLILLETLSVPQDRVREYEGLLHSEFAHLRCRGEWFNISPEDAVSYLTWFGIRYLSDFD